MKNKLLHIILILTALLMFGSKLYSQCDFFGAVTVVSTGYTSDVGYTQTYILVEEVSNNPGDILELNSDGDFGIVDEGTYFIYAVNYSGALPSQLAVGESYSNLDTYSQVAENCFEISGAYLNRAIIVCSSDDICFGNPIEIAVQNYEASGGYMLRYILVTQSDGTIVDFNDDGSFASTDYSSAGSFDAYALSTNDNDLIIDLTQGMTFTDFTDLADATCASLLGPREVTVLDHNFVYVADGQSIEATAFCEVDGWTHYSTAANPHNFVFSIYKNTNDISAIVNIDVAASGIEYFASAADSEYSTHTLRRSWEVDASGADYNATTGSLTNPVKVRFYYPAAEKTLLNDITTDFLNGTNLTGTNTSVYDHNYMRESRWFKSNDGDALSLSTITTAEQITDAYSLTVVGDDLTTSNGINYVELADINGFSGGSFAMGTGPKSFGDVLPVEYITFTGYYDGNADVLSWVTASEVNNDYFDVELSYDMITFNKIGQVQGNGNSNIRLGYSFINTSVLSGTRYYRLKQVDYDEQYKYSEYISLFSSNIPLHISVYPNPFIEYINISFSGIDKSVDANLRIYDNIGHQISDLNLRVEPEENIQMFLNDQPSGIYFLKTIVSKKEYTFKLIKK